MDVTARSLAPANPRRGADAALSGWRGHTIGRYRFADAAPLPAAGGLVARARLPAGDYLFQLLSPFGRYWRRAAGAEDGDAYEPEQDAVAL